MSEEQKPPETPECDKLLTLRHEAQAISEFVEWCRAQREPPLVLCTESAAHNHFPALVPIEALVVEYLAIDENRLEAERRAILKYLRRRGDE